MRLPPVPHTGQRISVRLSILTTAAASVAFRIFIRRPGGRTASGVFVAFSRIFAEIRRFFRISIQPFYGVWITNLVPVQSNVVTSPKELKSRWMSKRRKTRI